MSHFYLLLFLLPILILLEVNSTIIIYTKLECENEKHREGDKHKGGCKKEHHCYIAEERAKKNGQRFKEVWKVGPNHVMVKYKGVPYLVNKIQIEACHLDMIEVRALVHDRKPPKEDLMKEVIKLKGGEMASPDWHQNYSQGESFLQKIINYLIACSGRTFAKGNAARVGGGNGRGKLLMAPMEHGSSSAADKADNTQIDGDNLKEGEGSAFSHSPEPVVEANFACEKEKGTLEIIFREGMQTADVQIVGEGATKDWGNRGGGGGGGKCRVMAKACALTGAQTFFHEGYLFVDLDGPDRSFKLELNDADEKCVRQICPMKLESVRGTSGRLSSIGNLKEFNGGK